jgi:ATP-dependent Clp protease ATP-binding subunit ClpC
MFERFTEKARRVIFFGRYEASQFGSPYIETEHLLLGLLREDTALARRFLRAGALDSIRKQIEANTEVREKSATSADLPLSSEGKRVLAYSAKEAERLSHKHIGTEHLLLGLLREERCFAAKLLKERGVGLEEVRSDLALNPHEAPFRDPVRVGSSSSRGVVQSSYLATIKPAHPLVGREAELERVLQVLGRRHANNPVLVGEPGVGKGAIVSGLAQRIADGTVPTFLNDATLAELDQSAVVTTSKEFEYLQEALQRAAEGGAILVVDELHTAEDDATGRSSAGLKEILKGLVVTGRLQVLSVATPAGFARAIADRGWLESCFQTVRIAPASPEETARVLRSIKEKFEEFHGVIYLDEALERCIACAKACLPGRSLPGGAVDVMDEAGSLVKLSGVKPPEEVIETQKRLQFITRRMEASILNHEFEKARFYSDEERKERENLRMLREKLNAEGSNAVPEVSPEAVERVISHWTSLSLEGVRRIVDSRQGEGAAD